MHLGCGKKYLPGFINIDLPGGFSDDKLDVACDLRKLPFPDGYADEAHAYHILEHFYRWEADEVLAEWRRVLKPGGVLILELPCLDRIIKLFADPANFVSCRAGLFGEQKHLMPEMTHKWCYTVNELGAMLSAIFKEVFVAEPRFHRPERDMRFEAVK